VVGDCVVIGGPASTVLALDAWSGDLRWTCRTGGDQVAEDPISVRLLGPMDSSPAIIDGVVYINDLQLLALDLATGAMRWAAPVSTTATTSPAVADGVVYTAELGGAICAVDAATGDLRWRTATRDVLFAFSTIAVVDDTVIACGQGSASGVQTGSDLNGGVVLALDATTGAVRWRNHTRDPVLCSPAVSGDVAYITETGTDLHLLAYAVDSGEVEQRRKLGTAASGQIVTSSPAITGGTLYVGLPDGHLIARPAMSSGRSGGGRRLTAWWGSNRDRRAAPEPTSDHLPAVLEVDDSEPNARPSARMSARRGAELQQLADHYATAAQAASERDEFDEAVGWSTRAVEVVEALCEAFPDTAEHKAVLAGQLYNRATMLDRAGDAERGAHDAQRALELYRERVPSDPGTYTPLALDAQSRLVLLLAASGQNAQAREVGAAAVDEHRALAERYPGHEPGLARTLARYSEAMVRTGDQQRALAAGREVLGLYRRRVGALGLDETLAFGRTAYNVATLLLPPTAQTAAEGWRAATDAFEQLTIVAQAGMGDAVDGARMLAEAFRATMDTG
jgi:tetratricopeptide (TPR) repeat protein